MNTGEPPTASPERGRLGELTPSECWELLTTQRIGRVAVIVGHYPLVFPVNYAVYDKTILYRTGVGTKLHSVNRSNVTFEVDEIDTTRRAGWSVMVKGVAQEVSPKRDRKVMSRAELSGAGPWAPGDREHVIRIVADQVTGRRIYPAPLPPVPDWPDWARSEGAPGDLF
jgi:nitroimidazol reductase NimA-like FMN-containing flavoprotein (pyridoxamine 5'-phosphate oxidase superfamily)